MTGLISGDGEAMGGLETFGGSVVVVGIDVIAIVVVVVAVIMVKAGERSFTRGRCRVEVHYGSNCLMKKLSPFYRGDILLLVCA